MRLAVFTICSNQHMPQAHVLLGTVRQFLPDADRFLILADECHPAIAYPEGCRVIAARELGIPDFAGFAFRYDLMEFQAALKPFAFLHLLGKCGYTHGLYFDPDIELFSAVPAITDALAANASFILTPHILAPAEQEDGPNDITVMRAGAFNLGFLGVSGTPEARDLLAWWARWLRWQCVNDQPIGLFVDQKFMDLVPGFAGGTRILHDPGLNVAYWNLSQRRFVPDAPTGPQVGGAPLGFFHYSGFDPSCPDQLSTETGRFRGAELPQSWRAFLALYTDRLRAAPQGRMSAGHYAYGRFASGVPIPAIARRMFRDDYEAWAGDPFETFEAWAHLPARDAVLGLGSAIPSLVMQWWHARNPALASFPLSETASAERVTRWWIEHGTTAGIDRRFLEPQALAAGLRPISVGASCPAPHPDRADATVIAPQAKDSPGGHVGWAQRASLSLAVGRVEALDTLVRAQPASGRLLSLCVSPDQLAPILEAVKPRVPGCAYRVFTPSAEQMALSPSCLESLGQIDEIWAPTRFIQAGLVLKTQLPVLHMPVAWRFPALGPRAPARPYILAECDGFPGCGELLAAIQAYEAAFGSRPEADQPTLVLRPHGSGEWDAALRAAIAGNPAVIVPATVADPVALVAGAACVLSLHRGEALGLPVARAMAYGVPVVATDYGGCTDLLTPETGFPVDFHLVPGRSSSHSAAQADACHAAWSLRDVFDRPDEARRRAANASRVLQSAHDPAAVAAQQAERLGVLGLLAVGSRSADAA